MKYLSLSFALVAAGLASAQDMPLHDILKPGEEWKPHAGEMPAQPTGGYSVDIRNRIVMKPGESLSHPLKVPTCCVVALGGSTLLVADNEDRYVWALRIEKDGTLGPGDRYCRLRVQGDERRKTSSPKEAYRAEPTAIIIDAANRTYVATNLGIQVFDPTGRLCGVFAAPGRVKEMAFDGNQLFARVDDRTYVRRMLAEGNSAKK